MSERLADAVRGLLRRLIGEILEDGCPAMRDPYLGRRCGRKRYARRRCFACVGMPGKPLDKTAEHAREHGLSLVGAFLEGAVLAGGSFRWTSFRFARLGGADLSGADLRSTDFSGEMSCPGADLSNASFRGADLTYARMRFVESIAGASFEGAVLEEVLLTLGPPRGVGPPGGGRP